MSDSAEQTADLRIDDGPPGWRIWRAALAGAPGNDGWESLIYSDAQLTGKITEGLGPFQLFGTMADFLRDTLAPRLVLRIQWHDAGQAPERSKTKIKKEGSRWLALNVDDEIACLLSLILGCRARSGGKVRTFSADDPAGLPMYAEHNAPVALVPAYRVPMMPELVGGRRNLPALTRFLSLYPRLEAQDAVALVRAARHYATALWVADNDPEQAWLQLVSALETVSTHWRATTIEPAVLFAVHFPEPARLIREAGGDQLLAAISPPFARLIGAGPRLADFIESFRPDPPDPRPPTGTNATPQVDWNNLRPIAKTIYGHRSALLHNGTPFPAALRVPPLMIGDVPEEKPLGMGSSSGNTTWPAADTPIHLHTFAHLTRGALLNWWTERGSAGDHSSEPGRVATTAATGSIVEVGEQ